MLVALGVLMFTVVVVTLVAMLMFARQKLVASGEVNILINDDPENSLKVRAGSTLLSSLAEKKTRRTSASD